MRKVLTLWPIYLTWVALFSIAALVVLVETGCSSINAIGAAETPEQRAYAAYGTYVIAAEKAADLAEQPNVPRNVKLALIRAEERASPVMDAVLDLLREYERIKAEVEASGTGSERLAAAATNLNAWVNQALPLVNELIRAVTGAQN